MPARVLKLMGIQRERRTGLKKINGTASVRSVIFRIAPVLCLALLLSLGTGGMRPVRAASVRETLPILQMGGESGRTESPAP